MGDVERDLSLELPLSLDQRAGFALGGLLRSCGQQMQHQTIGQMLPVDLEALGALHQRIQDCTSK